MAKIKLLECDIQRQVLDYLAIKGLFHWRNNTGMIFSEYKGKKRAFKMGQVGSPDIFVVKRPSPPIGELLGMIYGLEVKAEKGKQSPAQSEWQVKFEEAGGKYLIIRSLEDVKEVFN